jgi:hypothetical protein
VSGLVLEEVVVVLVVVVVVVEDDDSDTSPSPSESEPVADLSGNVTTSSFASEVIDEAAAPPTATDALFFFSVGLLRGVGSGTKAAEVPSDFVLRFVLVFATGVEPMMPSPPIAAVVAEGNVGEEEPLGFFGFLRLFFFATDVPRAPPPCICSSGGLGSGSVAGTGTDAFAPTE